MSGVRFELDFDDGGLGAALKKAVALGGDLAPVLTSSGQLIQGSIRNRFDSGTGPGGVAWLPSQRAPQAVEKRKSVGKDYAVHKTLVDTGALEGSITYAVTGNQVEIGSGKNARGEVDKYAAVHQFGATISAKGGGYLVFIGSDGGFHSVKEVTIPARPYVGFDDNDVADLDDLWTRVVGETFQ